MPLPSLDFEFDVASATPHARGALLSEAAARLDSGRGVLSPGGKPVRTKEGDEVRDFMEDVAEFAKYPVVRRITERDFKDDRPVPVPLTKLKRTHDFYWLAIPTVLFPRQDYAFNRLEMKVVLRSSDPAPHLQPKAHAILPPQEFQPLLTAHTRLAVSINEDLGFSAKVMAPAVAGLSAGAAVGAKAAAEMEVVAGPFEYRIVKALIQHSAPGAETVFWRLDGAKFFQDDAPEIALIVKLPKEVRGMQVEASMLAYRYFNFLGASLQSAIRALAPPLRLFFEKGAPVGSKASWDVSPSMAKPSED